MAHSPLI